MSVMLAPPRRMMTPLLILFATLFAAVTASQTTVHPETRVVPSMRKQVGPQRPALAFASRALAARARHPKRIQAIIHAQKDPAPEKDKEQLVESDNKIFSKIQSNDDAMKMVDNIKNNTKKWFLTAGATSYGIGTLLSTLSAMGRHGPPEVAGMNAMGLIFFSSLLYMEKAKQYIQRHAAELTRRPKQLVPIPVRVATAPTHAPELDLPRSLKSSPRTAKPERLTPLKTTKRAASPVMESSLKRAAKRAEKKEHRKEKKHESKDLPLDGKTRYLEITAPNEKPRAVTAGELKKKPLSSSSAASPTPSVTSSRESSKHLDSLDSSLRLKRPHPTKEGIVGPRGKSRKRIVSPDVSDEVQIAMRYRTATHSEGERGRAAPSKDGLPSSQNRFSFDEELPAALMSANAQASYSSSLTGKDEDGNPAFIMPKPYHPRESEDEAAEQLLLRRDPEVSAALDMARRRAAAYVAAAAKATIAAGALVPPVQKPDRNEVEEGHRKKAAAYVAAAAESTIAAGDRAVPYKGESIKEDSESPPSYHDFRATLGKIRDLVNDKPHPYREKKEAAPSFPPPVEEKLAPYQVDKPYRASAKSQSAANSLPPNMQGPTRLQPFFAPKPYRRAAQTTTPPATTTTTTTTAADKAAAASASSPSSPSLVYGEKLDVTIPQSKKGILDGGSSRGSSNKAENNAASPSADSMPAALRAALAQANKEKRVPQVKPYRPYDAGVLSASKTEETKHNSRSSTTTTTTTVPGKLDDDLPAAYKSAALQAGKGSGPVLPKPYVPKSVQKQKSHDAKAANAESIEDDWIPAALRAAMKQAGGVPQKTTKTSSEAAPSKPYTPSGTPYKAVSGSSSSSSSTMGRSTQGDDDIPPALKSAIQQAENAKRAKTQKQSSPSMPKPYVPDGFRQAASEVTSRNRADAMRALHGRSSDDYELPAALRSANAQAQSGRRKADGKPSFQMPTPYRPAISMYGQGGEKKQHQQQQQPPPKIEPASSKYGEEEALPAALRSANFQAQKKSGNGFVMPTPYKPAAPTASLPSATTATTTTTTNSAGTQQQQQQQQQHQSLPAALQSANAQASKSKPKPAMPKPYYAPSQQAAASASSSSSSFSTTKKVAPTMPAKKTPHAATAPAIASGVGRAVAAARKPDGEKPAAAASSPYDDTVFEEEEEIDYAVELPKPYRPSSYSGEVPADQLPSVLAAAERKEEEASAQKKMEEDLAAAAPKTTPKPLSQTEIMHQKAAEIVWGKTDIPAALRSAEAQASKPKKPFVMPKPYSPSSSQSAGSSSAGNRKGKSEGRR